MGRIATAAGKDGAPVLRHVEHLVRILRGERRLLDAERKSREA